MRQLALGIVAMLSTVVCGQTADSTKTDSIKTLNLNDVTVTARRSGTRRAVGAENAAIIGREELFRAACCNLGESFTTNPSVDVNYSVPAMASSSMAWTRRMPTPS